MTATRDVVLRALSSGADYKLAAHFAGVRRECVTRWRNEDPDFSLACKQAKANPKILAMGKLMVMINAGHFPAIRFYLERTTDEFRARVIDRGTEGASQEDQAQEIADLIEAMDGNILEGAEEGRRNGTNGQANGAGRISVSFDDDDE